MFYMRRLLHQKKQLHRFVVPENRNMFQNTYWLFLQSIFPNMDTTSNTCNNYSFRNLSLKPGFLKKTWFTWHQPKLTIHFEGQIPPRVTINCLLLWSLKTPFRAVKELVAATHADQRWGADQRRKMALSLKKIPRGKNNKHSDLPLQLLRIETLWNYYGGGKLDYMLLNYF